MGNFTEVTRERLRWLHSYVRAAYELPSELVRSVEADPNVQVDHITGMLALYFRTAMSWDDWEYEGDRVPGRPTPKRIGMRRLGQHVETEHHDDTPLEFGPYDMTLPHELGDPHRDWRFGTFSALGDQIDDAPLDLHWTPDQIDLLDQPHGDEGGYQDDPKT